MDNTYVIHWKSRTNGRMGTGTTAFNRDEAEELAAELNRDFPGIQHEAKKRSEVVFAPKPESTQETNAAGDVELSSELALAGAAAA